jgi:hypothetical protein
VIVIWSGQKAQMMAASDRDLGANRI